MAAPALIVRDDLVRAHERAWARLAAPGAWWTGAEKVAIAAEVRRAPSCALCTQRKEALSPYAAKGEHDTDPATASLLPAAAIEAAHRITTDPGRLKCAWLEGLLDDAFTDGHYVELLDLVVGVFSIDSFRIAIGEPVEPLPKPEEGAPSGYRPPGARPWAGWLPTIPGSLAKGKEADLYADVPTPPNVIRALSLVPDAVRQLRDLGKAHYLGPKEMADLSRSPRAIDRRQIELIAGRVSARRECFY